jgi:hypothetical protein
MPITEDEWDDERIAASETGNPATTPVGEYETERDLVVAFLGENVDNAYTRAEIIKGVDFGETDDPDRVNEGLRGLSIVSENLLDIAGNVTATAIVIDDADGALDGLLEDGIVERREVEGNGETVTYYRLSGDTS